MNGPDRLTELIEQRIADDHAEVPLSIGTVAVVAEWLARDGDSAYFVMPVRGDLNDALDLICDTYETFASELDDDEEAP